MPYLCDNEQVLSLDFPIAYLNGLFDGLTDDFLILIDEGSVNVSVTDIYYGLDYGVFVLYSVGAQSHFRHPHAVVKLERGGGLR